MKLRDFDRSSEGAVDLDRQAPKGMSEAVGCLDLVTSDRVVGWAFDPDAIPGVATLQLVADGTVVATFKPDQTRTDILAQGMPNVLHGFDVALPPEVVTKQIIISVRFARTGNDLTGSPKISPRLLPFPPMGYFEHIDRGRVVGWAIDPETWPEPARLSVLLDGIAVAEIEPDVERPDVFKLGVPPGNYGFDAEIPVLSSLTREATVSVQFARIQRNLSDSPRIFKPRRGCFVTVEGAELVGWVRAASSDRATPAIDVFVDEEFAGQTRADVGIAPWIFEHQPTGAMGFRFTLPDRFRTRRYRSVSMRFAGSGLSLENSPQEVRWAAAPTGRQLALVTPAIEVREQLPTQIVDRTGSLLPDKARETGVVIQAVFSETGMVSPTVRAVTSELRALGFAVAIINNARPVGAASDCELASCCDLLLHKVPGGRDFGAWYTAVREIVREELDPAVVVFVNDSVIGPVRSLGTALDKFRRSDSDLWAMSESFQTAYHLQTSLFCARGAFFSGGVFQDIVDRYPFPEDKDSVILGGEIDLSQTALRGGARLGCLAPYGPLVSRWLEASAVRLSELYFLQRSELLLPSDIRHEIDWLERTRTAVFAGQLMNPQHDFWNTLISDYDYPFLKRELLAHNPAQVPVNEQLWSTLTMVDQAEVHDRILHELVFHGSSRFILPPTSARPRDRFARV